MTSIDMEKEFYTHIETDIVAKRLGLVTYGYDPVRHLFNDDADLVLPTKKSLETEVAEVKKTLANEALLVRLDHMVSSLVDSLDKRGLELYVSPAQKAIYDLKYKKAVSKTTAFFTTEAKLKGISVTKLIKNVIVAAEAVIERQELALSNLELVRQTLKSLIDTNTELVKYIVYTSPMEEFILHEEFSIEAWLVDKEEQLSTNMDIDLTMDDVLELTWAEVQQYRLSRAQTEKTLSNLL